MRTAGPGFPRQLFTHVPRKTCTQRGIELDGVGGAVGRAWKEPRGRSQLLDSYVDPGQDPKTDLSVRKPGFCFFEKKS